MQSYLLIIICYLLFVNNELSAQQDSLYKKNILSHTIYLTSYYLPSTDPIHIYDRNRPFGVFMDASFIGYGRFLTDKLFCQTALEINGRFGRITLNNVDTVIFEGFIQVPLLFEYSHPFNHYIKQKRLKRFNIGMGFSISPLLERQNYSILGEKLSFINSSYGSYIKFSFILDIAMQFLPMNKEVRKGHVFGLRASVDLRNFVALQSKNIIPYPYYSTFGCYYSFINKFW